MKYTEEDVTTYKNEISHLQQIIKSYEQHNLKIPMLERKLRSQKIEMQNMDSFYKDQLRSCSKKFEKYEEVIKCGQNNILSNSSVKLSEESNPRISSENLSRGPSRNKVSNISVKSITNSPDINSKPNGTSGHNKEVDHVISTKIDQCQNSTSKKIRENIHTFIKDLRISQEKEKSNINGNLINQTARENTVEMLRIPEEKSGLSEVVTNYQPYRRNDSSLMKNMQTANSIVNTTMQYPQMSKKIETSLISKQISKCHVHKLNQQTSRDASHETKNKITLTDKKIHSMMPKNTKEKEQNLRRNNTNPNQTFAPNIKTFQYMSTKFLKNHNTINQANNTQVNPTVTSRDPSNSILPNQQTIPCYNNINIFAGGVNNLKAGGFNIRQFIFNQISSKKVNAGSMKNNLYDNSDNTRSTSTLGNI